MSNSAEVGPVTLRKEGRRQMERTDIFFLKISLTVSLVLSYFASGLVHAPLTSSYVLIGIRHSSVCPDYSL